MSAKFKNGIYIDGGNADTASGQVYKINGTTVLSSTQVLGKGFSTTAGDITTIDATQTLTNKTLTSPTINGGTHTALTNFALRDTSAAFDVTITATSSTTLTAARTLTLDLVNAAKTIKLGGNITTAADFITSGASSLTLTTTGTTNATLPSGTNTLSTLGANTFTSAQTITPASNSTSTFDVKKADTTSIFTVDTTNTITTVRQSLVNQAILDSGTIFQVKNAAGTPIFGVDTTNGVLTSATTATASSTALSSTNKVVDVKYVGTIGTGTPGFYAFPPGATSTTLAGVNQSVYSVRFWVYQPITVTKAYINVTALVASSSVTIGIHAADGTSFNGNLSQITGVATTSTGVKSGTLSASASLQPNTTYYASVWFSGAPTLTAITPLTNFLGTTVSTANAFVLTGQSSFPGSIAAGASTTVAPLVAFGT
jgi:hypothetical protein